MLVLRSGFSSDLSSLGHQPWNMGPIACEGHKDEGRTLGCRRRLAFVLAAKVHAIRDVSPGEELFLRYGARVLRGCGGGGGRGGGG